MQILSYVYTNDGYKRNLNFQGDLLFDQQRLRQRDQNLKLQIQRLLIKPSKRILAACAGENMVVRRLNSCSSFGVSITQQVTSSLVFLFCSANYCIQSDAAQYRTFLPHIQPECCPQYCKR